MMKKHLDNIYRNRWQEYELADGTAFDSRTINWRDVPWGQVARIRTVIAGQAHEVDQAGKPGFKGFMCFRFYGEKREVVAGEPRLSVVQEWAVGWTDGARHHLEVYDFYTGHKVREESVPFAEYQNHVHPAIAGRMRGAT
jgi:hypothetical protein